MPLWWTQVCVKREVTALQGVRHIIGSLGRCRRGRQLMLWLSDIPVKCMVTGQAAVLEKQREELVNRLERLECLREGRRHITQQENCI